MNRLEHIYKLLDVTRLSLYDNFNAYDDDLPDTYDKFLENVRILNAQLNILIKDENIWNY